MCVNDFHLTTDYPDSELWSNGDVKLEEDGTPLVFWDSQWIPICGHYFWDNQHGAELFCRKMGFESGLFSGRGSGQKYEGDSLENVRMVTHGKVVVVDVTTINEGVLAITMLELNVTKIRL